MNSIKKDQTYSDAMKRLEEIVRKIESGEMDIDSLAENLKEAKQLVAFCKGKLQHVEDEVNKIMEGKE
ncbi:MAG: exodeoxyribonuclease VII small subunit [Bacteroidaceae bacterium]|jgi:exodeoxyribonuclease VII small subunit|nr:exodeoxyribonuclease VII small subunit [Bacteroidaceae bacterium]